VLGVVSNENTTQRLRMRVRVIARTVLPLTVCGDAKYLRCPLARSSAIVATAAAVALVLLAGCVLDDDDVLADDVAVDNAAAGALGAAALAAAVLVVLDVVADVDDDATRNKGGTVSTAALAPSATISYLSSLVSVCAIGASSLLPPTMNASTLAPAACDGSL
jgi:hypothetical protein